MQNKEEVRRNLRPTWVCWKSREASIPDLGLEGHACHTDQDSNFQQDICQRMQQDGECGETAGAGLHSQVRNGQEMARLSPHKTAQSQLETGGQDTQALAAGPESIGQGRALSHVHNWCEK